ncbi:MAG TPA: methylthioribulose 1-phosphate dehydratase [Vicinamibacteria bacterium]|nr:methylthioribulose 1-phosphate dehydratase [Vicinamibacteria bacterium]
MTEGQARAGGPTVRQGLSEVARRLADLGRELHARGWALGTSGNFSAVLSRDPLRLAITPRGADKGRLDPAQILEVDGGGATVAGSGRPSDETRLHLAVLAARGAGAVLHTHSIWATLLSEAHAAEGGLAIEGYEMLKGLEGVQTHEHREWVPILANAQDWAAAAPAVEGVLRDHPEAHAFLIRGHGLYTWGRDLAQARRHLEVLEFLLEVVGRAGRRA